MASAATPVSLAVTASATLFVALELSRSPWLVALPSPLTNKVSQPRLDGGDADGLLALIARKRGQAEETLGQPVGVVGCFEAGYDGVWLPRGLCARGIENRVLDAASLLAGSDARCWRWSAARCTSAAVCTGPHRPRRRRDSDRASGPDPSSVASTQAASRGG